MKYYSEILKKLYETEDELKKAEKDFSIRQAAMEAKRADEEAKRKKAEEEKRLEKEKYLKAIKDAEEEYFHRFCIYYRKESFE